MPSYYSINEQLEKIKNESDYRAKVDIAVDTLILVYKEQSNFSLAIKFVCAIYMSGG